MTNEMTTDNSYEQRLTEALARLAVLSKDLIQGFGDTPWREDARLAAQDLRALADQIDAMRDQPGDQPPFASPVEVLDSLTAC